MAHALTVAIVHIPIPALQHRNTFISAPWKRSYVDLPRLGFLQTAIFMAEVPSKSAFPKPSSFILREYSINVAKSTAAGEAVGRHLW